MVNPQMLQFLELLSNPSYAPIFLALLAWMLAWKGVALWKSVKNNHKIWFVAFLVVNTFGILEIVYLFYFSAASNNREKIN